MYPSASQGQTRRRDFQDRDKDRGERGEKGYFFRKKVCKFCVEKVEAVDYKDVARLQKFVTEKGKILPSRISGNCARHQRRLTRAIKFARSIVLLPFTAE